MIKRRQIFFCIQFYLIYYVSSGSAVSEDEKIDDVDSVVLVNILFRHGDRNPVDPYPTDPYKNLSYWPEGLGQLTDIGKEQHYKFGEFIRKRYHNLLPPVYNLNDILVRSTDVDRTLMSAESNLAGMYPPIHQWQAGLRWQPIPVHTVPEKSDSLLAMKKSCPRYDDEYKRAMNSPEIRRINEQHKELYEYVTQHTGRKIYEPIELQYVYNTLWIENLKKFTLPEWTRKVFPDKLSEMSALSFTLQAYTKELQRLKGGPLLGDMVKHMKEKSNGTLQPDRKMFVYSAHDTTVANFLMTLGVFDAQTPPYTAAVFVQLHQSSQGEFAVSVLYRNDSSRAPYLLQLPGCSLQCPLDQFIALTKPVIPENWEAECGLSTETLDTDDADLLKTLTISAVVGSGVLALLFVSLLVMTILLYQQKRDNHRYQLLRMEGP